MVMIGGRVRNKGAVRLQEQLKCLSRRGIHAFSSAVLFWCLASGLMLSLGFISVSGRCGSRMHSEPRISESPALAAPALSEFQAPDSGCALPGSRLWRLAVPARCASLCQDWEIRAPAGLLLQLWTLSPPPLAPLWGRHRAVAPDPAQAAGAGPRSPAASGLRAFAHARARTRAGTRANALPDAFRMSAHVQVKECM